MLRIGLTGGIGSGKTTVARLFAALNVPVIDADAIAHRLTQPGTAVTQEILAAFGPGIAGPDGNVNRPRLAEHVFSDPAERRRLEAILHPRIRAAMEQEVRGLAAPYCVLMIPLLVEAGQRDMVDRVLVVDIDEARQIEHTRMRDRRSEAEIRAILAAQASRAQRLAIADDVLANRGDVAALEAEVDALHAGYLRLAAQAAVR